MRKQRAASPVRFTGLMPDPHIGEDTGKPFATAVQGLLGASVEVVKRSELHTFVVLPKRWVVERSFAWLEKCAAPPKELTLRS